MTTSPNLKEVKELIALVFQQSDNVIDGNIRFTKLIFLLTHEVFPEMQELLKFYPDNYGPNSVPMVKIFNNLIDEDLIYWLDAGKDSHYAAEEEFLKYGEEIYKRLPKDAQEEVSILLHDINEWTTDQVLIYIYNMYPEYAVNGRRKNELMSPQMSSVANNLGKLTLPEEEIQELNDIILEVEQGKVSDYNSSDFLIKED